MRFALGLIVIALIGISYGCGSGRISTLDRDQNEAIIIAKVQIKNGNKILDNKWNFLFDERLQGSLAVWPDDQNYIYMKIPLGKHFISLIQYYPYSKTLPDDYLTIDIKENKIYYIGDILFHWTIDERNDASRNGIIGAMADSKKNGSRIKVEISDNYDNTVKYFNALFPNNQKTEKEILKVNN
jgi:hypothetical protein